ncbi:tetratricopeptide repeat protein [Ekhidna lutea]|nr:tetratricopeptide repeat protein [Ekhidna lutea]
MIRRVEAMNELGYLLRNSNADSTILLSNQAEQLARSMSYPLGEADAIMNRGIANTSLGNYYSALQEFLIALKRYRELDEKDRQAKIFNNLGRVHNFIGDTEQALSYYHQSAELYAELKNEAREGVLLNNIGYIHKQKGNYGLALNYLRKSLTRANKLNLPADAFYAAYNIGSVYMHLNEVDSSFKYLLSAEDQAKSFRDSYILSLSYIDLGQMYRKMDQRAIAESYFKKAYDIATLAGLRAEKRDAAKNMAELYEQSENYQDALKYYQTYKALNDSLINLDVTRRIAFKEAEDTFEQERMQQEIERRRVELANERKLSNAIWTRNTLIASLVIMILITYLVYLNFTRKRKANQALQKLNRQIEQQAKELRRANEEIISMNNNLEQVVRKRTEELEKKNQQLKEYLSSNSHIVRAPVARILGLVDLYDSKDSSNLEFINDSIRVSAIELDAVIRDINDKLSKAE